MPEFKCACENLGKKKPSYGIYEDNQDTPRN